MERRLVLDSVVVALSTPFAACLGVGTSHDEEKMESETPPDSKGDEAGTETPTDGESDFEIRFEEQEGDTGNRMRERVVIKNISEQSQDIRGYSLSYSSGYEYTFSSLPLEPRSKVAVVSQGTGDSVAESDPPTYYRDADLDELVLEDGAETVRLHDRDGERVVEATYEAER